MLARVLETSAQGPTRLKRHPIVLESLQPPPVSRFSQTQGWSDSGPRSLIPALDQVRNGTKHTPRNF